MLHDEYEHIIAKETDRYVAILRPGDTDFARMESELMQNIRNALYPAKPPEYLDIHQIRDILSKVLCIKTIINDDNHMELVGVYDDGIYHTDMEKVKQAAIRLNHNLTKKDLDDLIALLRATSKKVRLCNDIDLIPVNNGIFDYKNKKLRPFDPEYVFLSKSPVSFYEDVELKYFPGGWNVDDWLRDIAGDDEVCVLLWQVIGAILRPNVKWDKTVWLYSDTGCNGKSSYCDLLRNLIGKDAHVSIPITDFQKKFALEPLIGKQAIITEENMMNRSIKDTDIIKRIVTGDLIAIDRKYNKPVGHRFNGMMIQCFGGSPVIDDPLDPLYDNLILVRFEKSFADHMNSDIRTDYLKDPEVLEYVLNKVLMSAGSSYYVLSEPESYKNKIKG